MTNYNKLVEQEISKTWEDYATQGYFSEAQFWRGGPGQMSCLLFERMNSERRYFYIVNEWLYYKGIHEGVYTHQRSAAFLKTIQFVLKFPPLGTKDIQIGSIVKTTPVRDISTHYREVTIDLLEQRDSDMIIEGTLKEQHGYIGEHGSFYNFEAEMIYDELYHLWRIISHTPEEIEFKKKVR